jgi:esterase/lipase superfamily enzyme
LISENDKALGISRFLAGGVSRVGDADPERLADLGVTVVDLSQVKDTSSIHHTKFAEVPEVVQLIGARLEANGNFETSSTQPNRPAQVIQGIANVPIAIFGGRTRSAGLP